MANTNGNNLTPTKGYETDVDMRISVTKPDSH